MTTILRHSFPAVALLCIITLMLTGTATAGTYKAYSCQLPDGTIASTQGWTSDAQANVTYDLSCTDGSGLGVATSGNATYPSGFSARIGLQIPQDLSIWAVYGRESTFASGGPSGVWMWSAGTFGVEKGQSSWIGLNVCAGTVGICATPDQHYRHIWKSYLNSSLGRIGWGIACAAGRQPCPVGSQAYSGFTSAEFTLMDVHPPTLRAPLSGTLVDGTGSHAVRELHFSAADRGGGLRRAVLEVDGVAEQPIPLGDTKVRCRPPYGRIVPCPLAADATMNINTADLAPGKHRGRLLVYDVTESGPLVHNFTFDIAPPPPPLATPDRCVADSQFKATLRPRSLPFRSSKPVTFRVPAASSLPPDLLLVAGRNRVRIVGEARRIRGRYVATSRPRTSDTLRLALPLVANELQYRCSNATRLRVRAGVRLRVAPRRVRNGQSIRFTGRLLGGPHAAGRTVLIQARARGGPRRWTLVRALRTSESGRFRMRYTFRRTSQRITFEFRASIRPEAGFPYAAGGSKIRPVLVRG
jgi:hypothetical protein